MAVATPIDKAKKPDLLPLNEASKTIDAQLDYKTKKDIDFRWTAMMFAFDGNRDLTGENYYA